MCVCTKLLQSCSSLCDPMDRSLPGSSVHGILQARILEWVPMSSYRGSSWPRIKPASLTSPTLTDGSFTTSATWEAQTTYSWVLFLDSLWQSLFFNWIFKIMMFKVVIDIIRLISTIFATVFVTLILYSDYYLLLFFCLLWLQVNIQLRSSFCFSGIF